MSDNYDPEYDEQDNSPAGLRAALEKAKKQAREAIARAEKAEADRDSALKTVKSKSLVDILRDKKAPPALAKWLEKDDVEATPEAVDGWLKENGELFNLKPTTEAPADEVQDEVVEEDVIDPELAKALQASQRLDASGASPSAAGLMQRLESITTDPHKISYEDLVKQYADLGAPLDT